ncbi:hypothetical protein B9Z55_026062 [Caenorhabditis nigoni]|nr:hypothetical protein B9Z55_026062 [Caenorhabditis nigoni]
MLNEREDTKVQPMTDGPQKIKKEPIYIKMEMMDNQEQAEYGNMELHDETSEPERFFREQLPNPTGAKLSKLETLKLANAYLESLKMMLNEREDTMVQPMATGPKRIKMSEWIAQPVVVKQENVKSIKMEILDYQEQAEYGHIELHGEKKRFFKDLSRGAGET